MVSRFASAVRRCLAACLAVAVLPTGALACACGCGVFDVATTALLPTQSGGFAYVELDSLDQSRNWSGTRQAAAETNDDRRLRSSFFTAGFQYMLDRRWGVMADVPYWTRSFTRANEGGGGFANFRASGLGDVRLRGVYAGFSSDMSTGLTFGLKLPTGGYHDPRFDRDTAIGTGSTDVLLGLYQLGRVAGTESWNWFANLQADAPALTAGGYRPGAEGDVIAGAYFDRLRVGGVKLAPIAQATAAWRGRDSGTFASDAGSGYERVLLGPGLDVGAGAARLDASVAFPVYERVQGNQLVARQYLKVSVGYAF